MQLDTRNRLIRQSDVYQGSLNASLIRIGEVFRDAVRRNAAAIIVVHNHPSGDSTPSPEDIAVTRAIVEAGKLLDIEVLDHIIIGDNRYYSFAGEGLIEEYEADFLNLMLRGMAESRRQRYKTKSPPKDSYQQLP